jgi:hypothetical protein
MSTRRTPSCGCGGATAAAAQAHRPPVMRRRCCALRCASSRPAAGRPAGRAHPGSRAAAAAGCFLRRPSARACAPQESVRIRNKAHCTSIISYLDNHIQVHGTPSFACNLRLAVEGNIGAGARARGRMSGPAGPAACCRVLPACCRVPLQPPGGCPSPSPRQPLAMPLTQHSTPHEPRAHTLTTLTPTPAGKSTFLQYITSESPTIQQRLHLVPEPVDDWQRVCPPGASPSAETFNILQVGGHCGSGASSRGRPADPAAAVWGCCLGHQGACKATCAACSALPHQPPATAPASAPSTTAPPPPPHHHCRSSTRSRPSTRTCSRTTSSCRA